jgi:resuscitation-promoting factor RpfC
MPLMSSLRWLAVLPPAGGLAVSLFVLSAGAPAVAAQDAYGTTRVTAPGSFQQAHLAQARQTEALMARHVWKRREREKEQRIAARHAARQAERRAERARARAAAQAAAPTTPSAPSTVGTAGMGAFEACVIAHESGGNPRAVNPASGAGGLFQFLPSTWADLGYPGLPQYAPVSEQEEAFAKLYAEAGTSPWAGDGCA